MVYNNRKRGEESLHCVSPKKVKNKYRNEIHFIVNWIPKRNVKSPEMAACPVGLHFRASALLQTKANDNKAMKKLIRICLFRSSWSSCLYRVPGWWTHVIPAMPPGQLHSDFSEQRGSVSRTIPRHLASQRWCSLVRRCYVVIFLARPRDSAETITAHWTNSSFDFFKGFRRFTFPKGQHCEAFSHEETGYLFCLV